MATEVQQDSKYKTINFALICIQIAYPYIYNQLVEAPDFKSWDEGVASKLKLRHLTDDEKDSLDATEEFDEDWEKITFRMCQKETFLSNRVFQVSGLLNKISAIINDDSHLGDTIDAVIALSAVTNLKAFDSAPKLTKFNRDNSDYKFNGQVYTKKTSLVRDVLSYYISLNPSTTSDDIKRLFKVRKNMDIVFITEEYYNQLWDSDPKKLGWFKKKDKLTDSDYLQLVDSRILISSNWPLTVQGRPAEFSTFLDVCKKNGIIISRCK